MSYFLFIQPSLYDVISFTLSCYLFYYFDNYLYYFILLYYLSSRVFCELFISHVCIETITNGYFYMPGEPGE